MNVHGYIDTCACFFPHLWQKAIKQFLFSPSHPLGICALKHPTRKPAHHWWPALASGGGKWSLPKNPRRAVPRMAAATKSSSLEICHLLLSHRWCRSSNGELLRFLHLLKLVLTARKHQNRSGRSWEADGALIAVNLLGCLSRSWRYWCIINLKPRGLIWGGKIVIFFLKASRSTFGTEQNIPMLLLRSIVRFFFNFVLRICKEIARFGDAQQK